MSESNVHFESEFGVLAEDLEPMTAEQCEGYARAYIRIGASAAVTQKAHYSALAHTWAQLAISARLRDMTELMP